MLDSDIADADSHLHIEFFTYEVKDKLDFEGNKITDYEGKPFIRIMNPGDKTFVLEQPAKLHYQRRFPRQWLAFQMQGQADFAPIGTPLEAWNKADPEGFVADQMRELVILGFRTVEQVATASDAQLQRVGMGGVAAREKARRFLNGKNQSDTDRKLADTEAKMAEMQAMLTQLLANGSVNSDAPRRGPGRPKKDVTDVNDDDAAVGPAGDERVGDSYP